MKINGVNISPVGNVQNSKRIKNGNINGQPGEDGLTVSDKAQVYKTLVGKVNEIPPVREDRVSSIREQINSGDFKVDARKIAEKIISPNE